MSESISPLPLPPDQFKQHFAAIAPLILEEWSDLSQDSLLATAGELDPVVTYIASVTEQTRTLTRRQLRELYQLALAEKTPKHSGRLSKTLTELTGKPISDTDLKDTVELLEQRTEKLIEQLKQEVLPELSQKVRNNVGGSLLTALGIGFILGLLLGGSRGR